MIAHPRALPGALLALGISLLLPPAWGADALPTPRRGMDALGRPIPTRLGEPIPESGELPFPEDIAPAERAQWTVLLYIGGDNDLEAYVAQDIETELGRVGSSPEVQVVALADRAEGYDRGAGNWTTTKLFHILPGQRATAAAALADLGERNLGDPETLRAFLLWGQAHFPAERYALVMWDHGWSWRPGETILDTDNQDALDQDELPLALEGLAPFEVIAWDACFMASLEVQATLRPYAKTLVGSEDYVGYEGFHYEEVLARLNEEPALGAEAVAVAFSESMRDRTSSALALDARWDALNGAVNDLAVALLEALPEHREAISAARGASQRFGDPVALDLYDVALNLKAQVPDAAVQGASRLVLAALDAATLHEWHRDVFPGAHGTTIYWPEHRHDRWTLYTPTVDEFTYYREALAFSQGSQWDEWLVAYTARR